MDLSSSPPESPPNHDHQQLPDQSTPHYYHSQNQQEQHYTYNPPPGYGFPVNPVQQMAQLGLNPVAAAAVVALSQLAQFQATPPHQGQTLMPPPLANRSLYNSGGRRGSRSFRGRGRGYNCQHLPKTGDYESESAGAGGGPQCFQQHGPSSASQPSNVNVNSTDEAEPSLPKAVTQTAMLPQASQCTPTAEKASSSKKPPQGGRCELCKVECTSLGMLEEHNKGKKHRKNLQRTNESKIAVKPGMEEQKVEKPTAMSENERSLLPNSDQESEEKKPAGAVGKQQITGEKHGKSPIEGTSIDCFDSQRCGMKRKISPLICDLCNVKCDSQVVFDLHISGKKHAAKLKRFGPVGLQVLYPAGRIVQTVLLQGNQQPGHQPQGSHPAAEVYVPPQAHQETTMTSGLNPLNQQILYKVAPENAGLVASKATY
ncbi:hypothetical protein PTKIN_Ptkin04bG0209400 [Pterospermum kingtungense]